jgi:PAS domain S-box-containing protein
MNTLAQLPPHQSMKIPAFLFTDSEGKYRWIDTTVTNMTHDPAVGGIVANSRDVTERIVNELKIQHSIERFDIVFKATSDAIWDLDVVTGKIEWNKAIRALFGYKVCTYTREWWEERVHPDDLPRIKKKLMSMIKGKKSRLINEYRFRCADNNYKNVLDRSFLMYNESGELIRIIGSMQDVTAREKYIRTIEAQNERLKEIAWTQSHIVRVPLANIMGLVEL